MAIVQCIVFARVACDDADSPLVCEHAWLVALFAPADEDTVADYPGMQSSGIATLFHIAAYVRL